MTNTFFSFPHFYTFQLTRSRGAWRTSLFSAQIYKTFQLTRSRGAWRGLMNDSVYYDSFQLTRSRGAWLKLAKTCKIINTFQLTRSRGAWLIENVCQLFHVVISTHTLTWSVTNGLTRAWLMNIISTHTLTWSVTCTANPCKTYAKFQLTRSRGAWLIVILLLTYSMWFQLTRSRGAWPG